MSTDLFDAGRGYELDPSVEVRPEPFGALLYSFSTRRLSFLKDPTLVTVVRSLSRFPSAREACVAAGIDDPRRLASFEAALGTLTATRTIRERHR
ncbi:mycofactocin biosynthesis chaperone MftB [Nakamurella sp. YIM 132087]|uniref:Mycofactocin biosynthesis chaperone MftB n=1 Tax=Nakamurella alba TaxID=2665158 RepID=A0A7K1FMX6_9ACTN|nr:mycofactocin biosynthesis chaperone MftB [Nakamurella alba]MTD15486.1 mycofactocin biosynthesis chaperone MftB [Nakamurella alba]